MASYIPEGSHSYHHLEVVDIRTYDDKRFIKCKGATFHRDLKNPSGFRVIHYGLTVKVLGYLVDYVDFELDKGDKIFVVGYPEDDFFRREGYSIKFPILTAESIYKEDYLKYFPRQQIGEQ